MDRDKLLIYAIFGGLALSNLLGYCEKKVEAENRCRTKTSPQYLTDGQVLTCPANSHVVVERDAKNSVLSCKCLKP